MSKIKFSLWNAEWMNELFTGDPVTFHGDDTQGYMTKHFVGERRTDISGVINDVQSDIWVLVEGPNQASELQLFFDQPGIDGDWKCTVQPAGAQSVGLAVRTDTGMFAAPAFTWHDVHTSAEAEYLKLATNDFKMDTDGDGLDEVH